MTPNPDSATHELDLPIGPPDPAIRELDHRSNDGIDVTLLWDERTNRVSLSVRDERTGESFELDVHPEDALTAFHHPYAYASRSWIEPLLAA
jgi:hypothetical protein